jgi:hypothetical protein
MAQALRPLVWRKRRLQTIAPGVEKAKREFVIAIEKAERRERKTERVNSHSDV